MSGVCILEHICTSVHLFEKPLIEVSQVFVDCFVMPVILWNDTCSTKQENTHENPVNLLSQYAGLKSLSSMSLWLSTFHGLFCDASEKMAAKFWLVISVALGNIHNWNLICFKIWTRVSKVHNNTTISLIWILRSSFANYVALVIKLASLFSFRSFPWAVLS